MAVAVTHRQRIAALAVAQDEPALEVDRPHVIGLRGHGQPVVERAIRSGRAPSSRAQAMAPENLADGAAGRRRFQAVFYLQNLVQFLWPPRAMQPAFRENQGLHRLVGAQRKAVRPMTARLQSLQARSRVALQVFVAGLAADAELLAQLRDREAVALRQYNESINLFH